MFRSKLRVRSQLLIDPNVQLPILQRTALYTGACAIYFMVVLFFSESGQINHESPWKPLRHWADVIVCWAPGLTMLAPIIAYDVLICTSRFAGPMFRIRREMELLIKDESVNEVILHNNDHWSDVAGLFNEIRSELIELRHAGAPTAKSPMGTASSDSDSLNQIDLDSGVADNSEVNKTVPKSDRGAAVELSDNTVDQAADEESESSVAELDEPTATEPEPESSSGDVDASAIDKTPVSQAQIDALLDEPNGEEDGQDDLATTNDREVTASAS